MSNRIEETKVRKKFLVELSENELKDRAQKAADIEAELTKKKEQYSLIRREQNKTVKEMSADLHQNLTEYRTGRVTQELDAIEYRDYGEKKVYWKDEAGKLLDEREMHENEFQTNLVEEAEKRKPSEIAKSASDRAKSEVADVQKSETKKSTKRSAVDKSKKSNTISIGG